MSNWVSQVIDDLCLAIDEQRLSLPTLPEIAMEVREAAQKEDIDIRGLSDVIAQDAALAARMLKVSNSPLYRGRCEVEDLPTAIGRFGIDVAASLATAAAMQQMFLTTSKLLDQRFNAAWKESVTVAGIAQVIGYSHPDLRAEQATLAGLLHNIGALPILTYAERNDELLQDEFRLDAVIEAAHGPIGGRILEAWGFPLALVEVPLSYKNFNRTVTYGDYADVVQVAYSQAFPERLGPDFDWLSLGSTRRLGLDVEEITLGEAAQERVEQAQLAFA